MEALDWWIFLFWISLIGLFFVTAFSHAVRRMRSQTRAQFFQDKKAPLYFRLQHALFKENPIDTLLFCTSCTQQMLRMLYLLFCMMAYLQYEKHFDGLVFVVFLAALLASFVIVGDLIPRLWAYYAPVRASQWATPIASLFLLLFSPLSFLFYRLIRLFLPQKSLTPFSEPSVTSKEKLLEIIQDIDDGTLLNDHDKKLVESVLNFRDRIVREIMMPRVSLFCLPHDSSIREAAHLLEKEGYSRVPVYKGSQDQIIGLLMYKDILSKYMEYESRQQDPKILGAPIETIMKDVLYTPETKKLPLLLQEFRKKRMHLAVVVDEYGGTAGVVTIEDILEEIVGEIADEYDETQTLIIPTHRGSWIVDGKVSLLDLEEELNIKIPQKGDYDTIAGYVFFQLGTIPKKGVILYQDTFEIEILSSGDRYVEKVKITPLPKKV